MAPLRFSVNYYIAGAPWDTLLCQFLASVVASALWRVVPAPQEVFINNDSSGGLSQFHAGGFTYFLNSMGISGS